MSRFIYQENDIVKCIEITEENVEELVLGRTYLVIGAQPMEDGDILYTVIDKQGNVCYTIDRFKILDR